MRTPQTYGRELVVLRNENRWQFLNTLFSISEAVMYMQVGHAAPGNGAGPVCMPLTVRTHVMSSGHATGLTVVFAHAQMVDRLDAGALPLTVAAQTYPALHKLVGKALFRTHVEGKLKVSATAPPMLCAALGASCNSVTC